MEFLAWVILALLAYSVVAPLASIVTEEIQPSVGLFLSTVVFLLITSAVLLVTGTGDPGHVVTPAAGYVYVAGVFLTVGILTYTAALELGPVSVVVPIFGMFIVGSSALGIIFLDETLSPARVAGIICAVAAIVLGAGEEQ